MLFAHCVLPNFRHITKIRSKFSALTSITVKIRYHQGLLTLSIKSTVEIGAFFVLGVLGNPKPEFEYRTVGKLNSVNDCCHPKIASPTVKTRLEASFISPFRFYLAVAGIFASTNPFLLYFHFVVNQKT